MGLGLAYIYICVLMLSTAFEAESAGFHALQRKLLERSQQGLPADDIIISDVKQWVTKTIDELSNRVAFIGDEIEKAVKRQQFLDHDQFLSDEAGTGSLQLSDLQRESPPYSVLCASAQGYEARRYERALWVLTFGSPGEDFLAAKISCESKIKQYILGYNERGVKIKVTSPWLSQVSSNNEEGESKQYSFLFYLPTTMQDDPPPPLDPTIFFEYKSPKVFAFSYSSEASEDAYWTLVQDVAFQLAQSREYFHTDHYYLADYEAPFYKESTNNEILIPMDDSYSPHCGDFPVEEEPSPRTTPSSSNGGGESSVEDVPCIDCSSRQTTPGIFQTVADSLPEEIHLQVMRKAKYLSTTTNTCSSDKLDVAVMELLLNYQEALPETLLQFSTPQNVLLRVNRNAVHGAEMCNDVSVDVLIKIPRRLLRKWDLPTNWKGNISVKTLPTALIYTKPFTRNNPSYSLLDTSFMEYFELHRSLLEQSLCFAEREFFINANLESPQYSSSQVWIPYTAYSDACLPVKDRAFVSDIQHDSVSSGDDIFDSQRDADDHESSGSNVLIIDELW